MADEKWCALHRDLLELILEKVASSIADMIRFQAVCWSWNCAVKSYVRVPYDQAPLLMHLNNRVHDGSIVKSYVRVPYDQAPLLMHLNNRVHDGSIVSSNLNEKDSIYFFSMTEKTVYKLDHVFEDEGYNFADYKWHVVGGSHGWLVIYRRNWRFEHPYNSTVWLFNPITGSRIELLKLSLLADRFLEFYMKIHVGDRLARSQIESIPENIIIKSARVICDSSQFNNNNFAVVVIYQGGPFCRYQTLAFWKPGNNAWTSLGHHDHDHDHDHDCDRVSDRLFCNCIEFMNGQLFALFSCKIICVWDLRTDSGESYNYDNLTKPPIAEFQPFMDAVYLNHVARKHVDARQMANYLVESGGELLLVERYSENHYVSTGKQGVVVKDCHIPQRYSETGEYMYFPRTSTHYFFIFKLNFSDKNWERVEHLHGRALCLNDERSGISIPTQNFREFQENSIYFMYEDLDIDPPFHPFHRLGLAYNLKSKVVHTYYKFKKFGIWIVPNPW